MSGGWRRVALVLFLLAVLGGGLVGERLLAFTDEARATLREYDQALETCIREVLENGKEEGAFRDDLSVDVDTFVVRHMLDGLAERTAIAPDEAASVAAAGVRTVLAALAQH